MKWRNHDVTVKKRRVHKAELWDDKDNEGNDNSLV